MITCATQRRDLDVKWAQNGRKAVIWWSDEEGIVGDISAVRFTIVKAHLGDCRVKALILGNIGPIERETVEVRVVDMAGS